MPDVELRAGDAERDQAVTLLREHCASGHITIDELDDRVGRAYAARGISDLQQLLEDLPRAAIRRPSSGRFFWPGIAPFREVRRLRGSCLTTFEEALREIVPRMGTAGYALVEDIAPRRLVFQSTAGNLVTVMFHPPKAAGPRYQLSVTRRARCARRSRN